MGIKGVKGTKVEGEGSFKGVAKAATKQQTTKANELNDFIQPQFLQFKQNPEEPRPLTDRDIVIKKE